MANPFPESYDELNPVFKMLKAAGVHCYEYMSGGGNYHIAIQLRSRFILVNIDEPFGDWSIVVYRSEVDLNKGLGVALESDHHRDADPETVVAWIISQVEQVRTSTARNPRVTGE